MNFTHKVREFILNSAHSDDINTETFFLITEINRIYTNSFPLNIKMVSPKRLCKPWISSAILKSIKTKAQYFKKLGIISSKVNKAYRNKLNSIIRVATKNYYLDIFSKHTNDIRKTWKAIRNVLNNNPNSKKVKSVLINDDTVTDCS